MRFYHPSPDLEFEIPDSWLSTAGALAFAPSAVAYDATSDSRWPTELVSITEVTPPQRDPGIVRFSEERTVSILKAFVARQPIPPVEVHRLRNLPSERLSVRNGYHRYFLSLAVGFTMLPVTVCTYFSFSEL